MNKNLNNMYKRMVMTPFFRQESVEIPYSHTPYSGADSYATVPVTVKSIRDFSLEEVTSLALDKARRKGNTVDLSVEESIALFKAEPFLHQPW